jgi:hypothetical protein
MEHDRFLHEIKHLNVYIIYMTAVNIIDLSTELCDARCLFHFSFVWSIHGKCHASRDADALFVTSFQSMLWSSMKILTWDIRVEEDFHGNFTTSKMLFINTFEFSSHPTAFFHTLLKPWPSCLSNLISRHFFSQFWPLNASSLEPMKSFVKWMIWATTLKMSSWSQLQITCNKSDVKCSKCAPSSDLGWPSKWFS